MTDKTAKQPTGEITLQTIPMPADTNANGDIFGGWLMGQMDLGAAVLARRRARGRVATVAVDGMEFHKPVKVGDILAIHAVMVREGHSSMQIAIEAWITRMPAGDHMQVTKATYSFVAIDDQGKPRPLPR